ncbi:MAG: TonB family protein [Spirochaetes bacterium]|nr:TonB family protein [Spirochaetota bacterium]
MKQYKTYPYPVNFFRLRPELLFFLITFSVLLSLILFIKWNKITATDDFVDLSQFEMVELEIPAAEETAEPDIAMPDEVEESSEEEEKKEEYKFGDDSGKFDLSAMSVVPPKPRVAALPPYPNSVRKLGVEGVIVVEVGIDENGTIIYAKIVKDLHPILNRATIEWIKNISFYPAIDPDGNPFRCKIFWPIRFQLTN